MKTHALTSERILKPQMIRLASQIDELVYAELLKAEYPWVGRA